MSRVAASLAATAPGTSKTHAAQAASFRGVIGVLRLGVDGWVRGKILPLSEAHVAEGMDVRTLTDSIMPSGYRASRLCVIHPDHVADLAARLGVVDDTVGHLAIRRVGVPGAGGEIQQKFACGEGRLYLALPG